MMEDDDENAQLNKFNRLYLKSSSPNTPKCWKAKHKNIKKHFN